MPCIGEQRVTDVFLNQRAHGGVRLTGFEEPAEVGIRQLHRRLVELSRLGIVQGAIDAVRHPLLARRTPDGERMEDAAGKLLDAPLVVLDFAGRDDLLFEMQVDVFEWNADPFR